MLTKPRLVAQERFDLEDLDYLLSAIEADQKALTKQFWSSTAYILKGFTITTGVGSASVAVAGAALLNPENSGAYSWYVGATGASALAATLVASSRNYLELELYAEDGTPLTRAFWDQTANDGEGAEFNQTVNTVTDLKVRVNVNQSGFTGGTNTLPLAILDTDSGNNVKVLLDRRNLFFRLALPTSFSNTFSWTSQSGIGSTLSLSGVSGTFVADETVTFSGGATGTVLTGGTTSIVVTNLSSTSLATGNTVTGGTSGATGTLTTLTESFTGGDKSIGDLRSVITALQSEIMALKGTSQWYYPTPGSFSQTLALVNSMIAPNSSASTSRWAWTTPSFSISDGEGSPAATDVLAYVRLFGSSSVLSLCRQDGATVATKTGNTSNGTASITGLANTTGLVVGVAVSGTGIQANTVITAVGANSVTLNQNATSTATGTTFTFTVPSISLNDGEILYVTLPSAGASRTYSMQGTGDTNYKTASRASFVSNGSNYWIAYREGTKVFVRHTGEIESGESEEISDQISRTLLANIGLSSENASPSYTSNIRGTSAESLVARLGVLTDAVGDSQEDRSAQLRSTANITWSGSSLTFSADIVLDILNTKTGTANAYTVLTSNSPISLSDGDFVYVSITRGTTGNVTPVKNSVTPIPAQTQANKDIYVLFRRKGSDLQIPLHKQLIVSGQTTKLGTSPGSSSNRAYPTVFLSPAGNGDVTTLAAAIAAIPAEGGVICLLDALTLNTTETLPARCALIGRSKNATITLGASGSLVVSNSDCIVRDVKFVTTQTIIVLDLNGADYCLVDNCHFDLPAAGGAYGIRVLASGVKITNNVFTGCAFPSTSTGIRFESGYADNTERDNIFTT